MIRVITKGDSSNLKMVEGIDAARAALAGNAQTRPRAWIDLVAPSADEAELLLKKELKFADYSVEDALDANHPAKVEEVGEEGERSAYLFVIARAPEKSDGTCDAVALFLRSRILVTVHAGDSSLVNRALDKIVRDPVQTIGAGIEFVAHGILDEFVDAYVPTLDEFENQIELMESAIVGDHNQCGLDKILKLRQSATQLHREARPMRDLMASLAREGHPLVKPKARIAFRDLYDQIQRTLDRLETDRELVASLRDAFLALQNNRMNEVMKTLTVVAVISGTLAVVTGVFGMNLKIPFSDAPNGFWISLIGMFILSLAILIIFRMKRWV
ncbi:MAG: magnesium transporter CorA family protein [Planctomycetes bacterium]|nr:magnesium transporter CorA family protein [Planctomycetota bacterium]